MESTILIWLRRKQSPFGDDINDIEMLQICGTGVAVSNAVTEVKAVADCVTLSNDEDGVASWIEKNIIIDYS